MPPRKQPPPKKTLTGDVVKEGENPGRHLAGQRDVEQRNLVDVIQILVKSSEKPRETVEARTWPWRGAREERAR